MVLSAQAERGSRSPTPVWVGEEGALSCGAGPEKELPGLHPASPTGQPLFTSHLSLGQFQGGWRLPLAALGVRENCILSFDSHGSPEGLWLDGESG